MRGSVVFMDMEEYDRIVNEIRYYINHVFELNGEIDRLREQNELAKAQLTRLAEIEAENEQLKRNQRWSVSHV